MSTMPRLVCRWSPMVVAALLAACATAPAPAPAPAPPVVTPAAMVAAIQAAGEHEKSVIAVQPLADPGITAWQQAAQEDVEANRYAAAAAKLDQALKLTPKSPDLMQDRAEVAIYQHDNALALKLAQESWTLGPKIGPLCARNQETLAQLRKAAGDAAGAAAAQQAVAKCHVQGIHRY